MIRSFLIHLSMNMWEDRYPKEFDHLSPEAYRQNYPHTCDRQPAYFRGRAWEDTLRCEDGVWRRVTERFAAAGGNQLLIDVGDGVVFRSHPEIALPGAWSRDKLRDELARCRDLGLEVIPKLNFSSCHDAWMKEYSRMLSTPLYYRVCRELIEETVELFGGPRFFHLGMDEEAYPCQRHFEYVVIRQGQLWWDDLAFYCDEVRRHGIRPWMWSDKLWNCSDEEYRKNIPTDVLQSNWYYHEFDLPPEPRLAIWEERAGSIEGYRRLEAMGYDQIPAGSNWAWLGNYADTVKHCPAMIAPERLLGYMTAPWLPTAPDYEAWLIEASEAVEAAHRDAGH